MYKRLLVAVDGSEQSYKALDHAIALAEKFGSELKILTVIPNQSFRFFTEGGIRAAYSNLNYQNRIRSSYEDILTYVEAKVRLEHADINVSTILVEGRPSTTIVDVADKEGCDMIFMGGRGVGGITGWVLGSTSYKVVNSCKKPVMIII